jgi:hypothetical protein
MRSCISAVAFGALLLVGLAILGWFNRDEIVDFVTGFGEESDTRVESEAPADPSLARRAEAKIISLGQGDSQEITLDVEELNGWVTGGLAGYFPEYISGISAAIEEELLVLNGDVAIRSVPGIEELGPMVAFLGDTANVTLRGRLDGLGPGRGVYFIDVVQIGMLPLPESARDELMKQIKGNTNDGLPDNAVVILLPQFVVDIGLRGDVVFLRK